MEIPTRRTFIKAGGLGAILFGLDPMRITNSPIDQDPYPGFPSQDLKSVREIVSVSHSNYDRVKELVTERPALAKASWDWGFGDWESALGAACHMGRVDIAQLLIEYGARPNLFTHCILGHVQAVKSIVSASPGVQSILGPHGITLMTHVKIRLGKDDLTGTQREACEEIEAYLGAVGGADVGQPSREMTDVEQQPFLGTYAFGDSEEDLFTVEINRRGLLSMRRGSDFGRVLNMVEDYGFEPSGGPGVRIRFSMDGNIAKSLTIHDPIPILTANRV